MKLLIVDDETELVATLVRFLGRTGHTSGTAFNLQTFKDYLAQNQPELVITNYRLPDGDGLEIVIGSSKISAHAGYPDERRP